MNAVRRACSAWTVMAAVLATALTAHGTHAAPVRAGLVSDARVLIDSFEDAAVWSAIPASGVQLRIGSDAGTHGRALRLDFDFGGGGGYAVARRAVAVDLPANYRFRFAVRGDCQPNDLEFKLIDASGDNVWWSNRRNFVFPAQWETLTTRKRQITFAWGPSQAELRHVAAIEIAITAGSGGKGTVWLDDLSIERVPVASGTHPAIVARASSSRPGNSAARAVDRDSASFWASNAGDRRPWVTLDLGEEREYGGMVIDWVPARHAADYDVEISSAGVSWRPIRAVRTGNGGRDHLFLPESESRWIRIRLVRAVPTRGVAIRSITIEPLEWAASLERFYETLASETPRGSYPRALRNEQTYWSVLGTDVGEPEEALLGEDGMLETGKAQYSIEPFLRINDSLVTWADVQTAHSLAHGDLPVPTVTWQRGAIEMAITAFAFGKEGGVPHALAVLAENHPGVIARYRVRNRGTRTERVSLYLALRPFQVNPASQFLNTAGGVARIRTLALDSQVMRVNGERGIASLTPPTRCGAATFDEGDIVEFLRAGRVPPRASVVDPFEHASGVLEYALEIAAGGEREVDLFIPLRGRPSATPVAVTPAVVEQAERATRSRWAAHQRGITIEVPPEGAEVIRAMRAQLGWILINRDQAAIQPGSRSYERSWIRDGSLTSTALLRLGHPEIVRTFIDWYAGYLYPDGKVPCCVDARGADPVPEHDSHGEFIYLIAEYHRYTGDRALVERHWPAVLRVAAYLDSLRQTRRTPEWRTPARREFFGLLPPSISHEGYSAKPMHSYWDDFFALRGFKDAAYLAGVLGRHDEQAAFASMRDQFQRELIASLRAAMARHKIDYLPGCADLGDFDATSTTIALTPAAAEKVLPQAALTRTFEKYWEFFRDRRDGRLTWDAYTPYETRIIGSMVRLGWRERADSLVSYFMRDRRPAGWQQWAEVVDRDPRHARFIGDMPHTWVGSDFVRSVLDLFAYEREADSTLVIGAGLPLAWVTPAPGVVVRGLPTPHGPLGFTMKATGDSLVVTIDAGVRVPRGGIVVRAPSVGPPRRASVNGVAVPVGREGIVVRRVPARIVVRGR